jgi:hypothetical protein
MDWQTHVILSGKLLQSCGLPEGAAIYSVLPAIDIEPIHYHRQYAHLLANAPVLLDASMDVFNRPETKARDFKALKVWVDAKVAALEKERDAMLANPAASRMEKLDARNRVYFYRRVGDEAGGFINRELAGALNILGPRAADISNDRVACMMSLVSHVYFDMFNNPVGCFIPFDATYSAHWRLWEELDYLQFKATFYNKEIIVPFRQQISDSDVWTRPMNPSDERDPEIRARIEKQLNKPYSAAGLIKAFIQRLGALAPGISPDAVDMTIRNIFGHLEEKAIVHADREILYCKAMEQEIADAIRKLYPKS